MQNLKEKSGFTPRFYNVFLAELVYLQKRREQVGLDSQQISHEHERLAQLAEKSKKSVTSEIPDSERKTPQTDIRPDSDAGLVGLALSGGGIRSATFNLGLLQGMARKGVLRFCDYLSTVSGGGYIGSCFSSLLDNQSAAVQDMRDEDGKEKHFPFRFERAKKPDERKEVKYLREHGNYLAVKGSLSDYARMIGTYLSGLVLTNLVSIALVILLGCCISLIPGWEGARMIMKSCFWISLFSLLMVVAIRGAGTFPEIDFAGRERLRSIYGAIVIVSLLFGLSAGIIYLSIHLQSIAAPAKDILGGLSIASVLGLVVGLFNSQSKRLQGVLKVALRFGQIAVIPVLLAWLLRVLWATDIFEEHTFKIFIAALVLLFVSLFLNTNRISLHNFYRDRLSKAYVIKRVKTENELDVIESNDAFRLSRLHDCENGAPYHLINTSLNVPGSADRYLRGRGADFFFFSKLFIGSESTGYMPSISYQKGKTLLATAMAISGAAASPQMGSSTNPILRFVMTLLNIRLNRWMPNPDPDYRSKIKVWPYYFVKEILGKTKETDGLLNLSDGGHHENLGIYPLLKRRCKFIIASDAAADPNFAMNDLANLQRKARIDLGVDIKMEDMELLRPDPETANTAKHYVKAAMLYPDGKEGVLLYVKSSLTGDEPEDLLAYRRKNPDFPDQTTADQFFDEAQFESYRKLGELIGRELFAEKDILEKLREGRVETS